MPAEATRLLTGNEVRPTASSGKKNPTIVVGMSGGVDSSTAAAVLLSRDYPVIGLTMQLWDQRRLAEADPSLPQSSEGRCCSSNDVYDARRVAEQLDIPFYVVNFQRQFEQTVVQPFVSEYLEGRTPIPCTLCNNHVKFDQLLVTTRQIGAEMVATGHYARVEFDADRGRYPAAKSGGQDQGSVLFSFWTLAGAVEPGAFSPGLPAQAASQAVGVRASSGGCGKAGKPRDLLRAGRRLQAVPGSLPARARDSDLG